MGKILCATRGGEAAIENQKKAIQHAKETGDELIFFYVVDVEFMAHANYALRADVVTNEMDKMADFLLAMAVERAAKAGVETTAIIRHGNFIEKLKDTVETEDITMVMLGKPGEGESTFRLNQLKELANSIEEQTGVDVWIPGLEEPGDE